MKNKGLLIMIFIFLIAFVLYFIIPKSEEVVRKDIASKEFSSEMPGTNKIKDTNYQATFAIYTNGVFRIFTAAMYHNQDDDVFISSVNPNVVHVKKANITWDDFFKTLPFNLTKECLITGTGQTFCSGQGRELKFYLNAEKDRDALDRIIREGDRLLVSFGNESESEIEDQIKVLQDLSR